MDARSQRTYVSPLRSTVLVGCTLVASTVHFFDNANRLDMYPGPIWLTRTDVLSAWVVVFVLACVALVRRTRAALIGYGLLGFAGLLHYVVPRAAPMPLRCTLTIAAECFTSALLIGYAVLAGNPA